MFYGGFIIAILGIGASVDGISVRRSWWRSNRSRWLRTATTPTTPPTTTPPTTTPPTTTPLSCEFKGRTYPPGSQFGEGYDADSNWCYGAYCSDNGKLVQWDNFNCKTTTPITTTVPPTPSPTPSGHGSPGCMVNGIFYHANSMINDEYDEETDWCYGSYCDEGGYVIAWDKWNCKKSTTPRITTTTIPPTTRPVTPSDEPVKRETNADKFAPLKRLLNVLRLEELLAENTKQ